MNGIFSIREELGISQHDLADYLAVSRSLLSLAEIGERDLPTQALVKLSKLELSNKASSSKGVQKTNTAVLTGQQAVLKKKLQQRAATCSFQATKLKKQLASLRQQHLQHRALFQTIEHLYAELPASKEGKQDKLWLEIQENIVSKKMEHTGQIAQDLLQMKINLLEFETKELCKFL